MPFTLHRERLGPLPIINHFLRKSGIERRLEEYVPTIDKRCALPYAKGLGVLLRSILVEREPIYRLYETAQTFSSYEFGLTSLQVERLKDDQIGRALDHLFDSDRGSLLTTVVVDAARRFELCFKELHNDSTSISFTGQYRKAKGRQIRGRRGPWITYGFTKNHRPDLKQLLFILTTTADGAIPVHFRCTDGNTADVTTHLETWNTLREAAGRPDFLYVADSKLCDTLTMETIDGKGGRFVTVLPRSRIEDTEFRKWMQNHDPKWEEVWDKPNPRGKDLPRDIWQVFPYALPSREGWPVIWVYSSLLALHQQNIRRTRLARAMQELLDIQKRLHGARPRRRARKEVQEMVDEMLKRLRVNRYLKAKVSKTKEHHFRQESPGRPGTKTRYRRITRDRLNLEWMLDEEAIAFDRKSDGMYPLLTNDRSLTPKQVLEVHKRQPTLEKRFEQTKSVYEIAPVLLKNEGRIEGLFFIYFLGLLIQALVERELRQAMKRERIKSLPLYPEERACRRPTAEQIFRLFSLAERQLLMKGKKVVQVFEPEFTDLQKQVLDLLKIPRSAYRIK